jgi:serine/threonine protein kinase
MGCSAPQGMERKSPLNDKIAYELVLNEENFIGKGGFGNVFKAVRFHDEKVFAIKMSKSNYRLLFSKDKQDLDNEVEVMRKLNHPFIVKVIDRFIHEEGSLCIVLDYYPDKDFKSLLEQRNQQYFEESEIKRFLANIIITISYIRDRGITHWDIKPENFLVKTIGSKTYLHLNDFGLAKSATIPGQISSTLGGIKGTLEYIAPEVIEAAQNGEKPDMEKVDVWSIGVIAY